MSISISDKDILDMAEQSELCFVVGKEGLSASAFNSFRVDVDIAPYIILFAKNLIDLTDKKVRQDVVERSLEFMRKQ